MHYPRFTEEREIELKKKKILSISDYEYPYLERYNWFYLGVLKQDTLLGEKRIYPDEYCMFCSYTKKKYLKLKFIDYRQFLEFFNLKENEIPPHMIEHLHQQRTMYVGNSILDDLDPVDGVNDPWFRSAHDAKSTHRFAHDDPPNISIVLPVCLVCLNKYKRKAKMEELNR